jgi:hypothetical protein
MDYPQRDFIRAKGWEVKLIRNLILNLRIRYHEENALWYDRHGCKRLVVKERAKVNRLKGMRV